MSTHKIFFSYSRSDSHFALRLAKDLREAGANIWIDQLDIPAGNHWDAAVEKALESSACVLVILTPASTASANVMDEISFALEAGKRIIPVLLDTCITPFRLRRLQWVDFTTDYNAGLTHLIASLNLTINAISKNKENSIVIPEAMLSIPAGGARLDELENEEWENELWEEACRINTVSSYKKYLNETISENFKAEARLLIKQLELEQKEDELEALLWQKAKTKHDKNVYRHYLQEYPDGNYKTLAIAAISDLEKAEKKSKSITPEKVGEKVKALFQKQVAQNKYKRPLILGSLAVLFCLGAWGFQKVTTDNGDRNAWVSALLKNDSIAYTVYQQKFPNGLFTSQAKEKLDSLSASDKMNRDSLGTMLTAQVVPDSTLWSSADTKVDSTLKAGSDINAKNPVVTGVKTKLSLGQRYKGGIIIYLNKTRDHGLIASNIEGGSLDWEKAKKVCEAYVVGSYSDWRMPSKDELNLMFQNKKYLGQYTRGLYWSATEENKNNALTQNFLTGEQAKGNKTSEYAVRAVRSF